MSVPEVKQNYVVEKELDGLSPVNRVMKLRQVEEILRFVVSSEQANLEQKEKVVGALQSAVDLHDALEKLISLHASRENWFPLVNFTSSRPSEQKAPSGKLQLLE